MALRVWSFRPCARRHVLAGGLSCGGALALPRLAVAQPTLNFRGLASNELVNGAEPPGPIGKVSPSGATGTNIETEAGTRPDILIEEQRSAADWVQHGLINANTDWQQRGWLAFAWGIGRQLPDGRFPNARYPEFGTAWFIEALSRSLLLEREFGGTSHAAQFLPGLIKAARWLAGRDALTDSEMRIHEGYTHRFWLFADALYGPARLAADRALILRAESFANAGIAAQRSDGVNPERSGYDVGYQAEGLVLAARYCILTPSVAERDRVIGMLRKGIAWLATRVTSSGDVDAAGSTRIGIEHDHRGRRKEVFYGVIVEAFGSYEYVTGDGSYHHLAAAVRSSVGYRNHFGLN